MRVLTVYKNGMRIGTPPRKNNHEREKRGIVMGWSASAARRNVEFLQSIDSDALGGFGYTGTFTLRDCPETSDVWHRLRRSLLMRFERMGMIRCHWVTEWQQRGRPHLHGIFFFREWVNPNALVEHWLKLAAQFTVSPKAQFVREVTHIVGWFKYVSKHANRGHHHYQRTKGGIPKGWEKTGRVWGYTGEWPIGQVIKLSVDDETFYRLRRLSRYMAIANSREPERVKIANGDGYLFVRNGRKIAKARKFLKNINPAASRWVGCHEWLSSEMQLRYIYYLLSQGAKVAKREGGLLTVIDGLIMDTETGELIGGG